MTSTGLLLLSTICFIAMVSPGPDFVLVTRNAISYPRQQAFLTVAGVVAGCCIHASYCVLGLAWVITKSLVLYSTIRYLGACYLIYLGIKGLLSKGSGSEDTCAVARVPGMREAFFEGFLCNLLNPKLAVFLLSLFTQFITPDATMLEKAIVAGVFVGESALYWPAVVFLLQSPAARKIFSEMSVYSDRLCGSLLIYLGIRVATASES